MSTEPVAAGVTPNPLEDGIPFGTKLAQLAEQRRDEQAVTNVALDGSAQSLTFGELDARANQWGRALAASGADTGSLVALAIPNSQHLMLATLGCWKIGAVPVPMHWDLPKWERDRVREVIQAGRYQRRDHQAQHDVEHAALDEPLPSGLDSSRRLRRFHQHVCLLCSKRRPIVTQEFIGEFTGHTRIKLWNVSTRASAPLRPRPVHQPAPRKTLPRR